MPNIIRHRRSTVAGFTPVAPDLVTGELAINAADGRLFTLLTSGDVVDVTTPNEVDGGRIVIPSAAVPAGFNSANYGINANWGSSLLGNVTSVGSNGGPSAYGTFDQSGNVFEWLQSGALRGGSYLSTVDELSSVAPAAAAAATRGTDIGFRIATRANPLSLSDFAVVGDNGNAPNFNGIGTVTYDYAIKKYPVTNDEYAEFLNDVARAALDNLYGVVDINDPQWLVTSGIEQSGTAGNYSYTVRADMGNKPVNYVSWLAAARYCNWLHNNYGDTETGAYTLTNYTLGDPLPARNTAAKYFVPTENEWYKAAYYKAAGAQTGYWRYATQSDAQPTPICATNIGNGTVLCAGDRIQTASGDFLITQLNDNLITAQDF